MLVILNEISKSQEVWCLFLLMSEKWIDINKNFYSKWISQNQSLTHMYTTESDFNYASHTLPCMPFSLFTYLFLFFVYTCTLMFCILLYLFFIHLLECTTCAHVQLTHSRVIMLSINQTNVTLIESIGHHLKLPQYLKCSNYDTDYQ